MTKRDLVLKISDDTGLVQGVVLDVVQKTLDYIIDELGRGNSVHFRNFGVFEVKVRKSRKGRNPNYPQEEIVIPDRVVARFRAGKVMRERAEAINPKKVN